MKKLLVLVLILSISLGSAGLSTIAMQQPGVDKSYSHLDYNGYMVAIQPSTTATAGDLSNAIKTIAINFSEQANETGYAGKLQIGITDRPGRVIYMLDIGAAEAIDQRENATWLEGLFAHCAVWQDDTRNYNPYGTRYTPIPNGKGVLGSMVMPWLGYKLVDDVWYDTA